MSADAVASAPVTAALLENGAVLRLVVDRPKGNVLTMEVMSLLAGSLAAHRDDRHLKLVLLRGAGGTFSYGASVEEHRRDRAPGMLAAFHALVRQVAAFPLPVAAVVEGRCLGGAFELVLACHLVFARRTAVFACPEIKLGVFPPVLAALGPARLGGALAERLLLTGEELGAEALASSGFITLLLDAETDPEAAVRAWYGERLASLSAAALRQATAAARAGAALDELLERRLSVVERRYLEHVLPSHDGNEGIEAFLERRSPRWEDA